MSASQQLTQDPVFKGCTRQATFLGVPLLPFLSCAGSCVVLAMYFSLWFLALAPVLVLICRQLCANDDAFFQLASLRLAMRLRTGNLGRNGGHWNYESTEVRDSALQAVGRGAQ